MNNYKIIIAIIVAIVISQPAIYAQLQTVGEHLNEQYESLHPYPQKEVNFIDKILNQSKERSILHSQVISHKKDTYICVHFSKLELANGDKLIIRSPDNSRVWEYDHTDNERGSFWSIPIYGNAAILEIIGYNKTSSYGYSIDKIARGFTNDELNKLNPPNKAICGSDTSVNPICFSASEPDAYEKSKAVARLLVQGIRYGTGWLVGNEGHIMTAGHVIENAAQAANTSVEMMAEGATCTTNCNTPGGCSGTIISDFLIYIDSQNDTSPPFEIDYSLSELPPTVNIPQIIQDYGFLTIRKYGAIEGERIYIPQHPQGYGKRIAMTSEPMFDPTTFITIQSVTKTGGIKHYGDTQGGSSGAPLISFHDNCVVGIHTGSTSTGTPGAPGVCPNFGFNGCQLLDFLGEISPSAICDCGGGPELDVFINTACTWKADKKMPNNLIIQAGGNLTILSSEVAMGTDNRIIIKQGGRLTLDGGVITACDLEWKGIKIEGDGASVNNELGIAGKLILKNNAVIEKARTAVSMNPSHLPWTGTMWGGFISAENSTFRHCRRALEFMKYGTSSTPDRSRFIGVSFEDILFTAVTSWADDGVTFSDCKFLRCGRSGILTHRSRIIVNSLIGGLPTGEINFEDMPTGIELLDPSSKAFGHNGSTISENKFQCEQAAIDIIAVDSNTPNLIENNFVSAGMSGPRFDGVRVIGTSNVNVRNNTFESLTGSGVLFVNAGASFQDNPITENLFRDCENGSMAIGDNTLTEYTKNCFENGTSDDILVLPTSSQPGAINIQQGFGTQEAGNCFSGGIPEIRNFGNPVFYFIHDPLLNTPPVASVMCHDVPNSSGLTPLPSITPNPGFNCGSTVSWIIPSDCELRFSSADEVIALIEVVDEEVLNLEISETNMDNQLYFLKSLTSNLLIELGRIILETDNNFGYDKNFLLNYYSSRSEFRIRSLVPSIHIEDENYGYARQALSQVESSKISELDYIDVQNIYLDFLEGGLNAVSNTSVTRLLGIANKSHTYSGDAFALYYLITGEKPDILYSIPDIELVNRKASMEENRNVSFFPNPTTSSVSINVSEKFDAEYTLRLFGMNGEKVLEKVLTSNEDIKVDVSVISSGIYSVSLIDSYGLNIFTDRLVITK